MTVDTDTIEPQDIEQVVEQPDEAEAAQHVDTEPDDHQDDAAEAAQHVDTEPDDHQDDAAEQDGDGDQDDDEPADDTETFSRTYVERLRRESQRYRERANEADGLAQRLHTALVAATGRLADPSDLDFDAAHLDDADALTAAIDTLIERKPHLRNRRPFGDIGQGASRSSESVDLAGMLRQRA